jgi:hypothetical protein
VEEGDRGVEAKEGGQGDEARDREARKEVEGAGRLVRPFEGSTRRRAAMSRQKKGMFLLPQLQQTPSLGPSLALEHINQPHTPQHPPQHTHLS